MENTVPKSTQLMPFLWVSLIWLAIAAGFCAVSLNPSARSYLGLIGLWFLCLLDLLSMHQAIASVLALTSLPGNSPQKPVWLVRAFFWGVTKLACLGLIGMSLWLGKLTPTPATLLVLATLVVVPLFGGFWWSQKELSHA